MSEITNNKFRQVEEALGNPSYRLPMKVQSEHIPCPNSEHDSDDVSPRFSINKVSQKGVCFKCNKAWSLNELVTMLEIN